MTDASDSKHPVEIEVKIAVGDLDMARQRLEKAGADLSAPRVFERNVRYENPARTLTAARRVLRLREDTRVRLTYKEPSEMVVEGAQARTELEVTVDDFATMNTILGKLGYSPAWLYEKYRTTYSLHDAEVVLDEMPFGNFIEVEGKSEAIEAAVKALNLTDHPRITSSYSDLFFQVKARLRLPFNDLTFDNFRDVTLPDGLFNE